MPEVRTGAKCKSPCAGIEEPRKPPGDAGRSSPPVNGDDHTGKRLAGKPHEPFERADGGRAKARPPPTIHSEDGKAVHTGKGGRCPETRTGRYARCETSNPSWGSSARGGTLESWVLRKAHARFGEGRMEKCSRSNSPAVYSTSTTAATRGTSSPISLGSSCPSACGTGLTGSDQWDLVLRLLRSIGPQPRAGSGLQDRPALCLPDACGLGSDSHGTKVFSGKLLEFLTQIGSYTKSL